nr:hypothetical protein [Chromobacterium sp. ASV5]
MPIHSLNEERAKRGLKDRCLEDNGWQTHNDDMSTAPSREEIDAKLAANVAEVKAVASEMRAEMTALRADSHAQFAELRAFMEVQAAKTEAAFASLNTKVEGSERNLVVKIDGIEKGLEGKIDGVKSSITTMQWLLGIVAALAAIWVGYLQLKQAEPPAAAASTSAVITAPAQPSPGILPHPAAPK